MLGVGFKLGPREPLIPLGDVFVNVARCFSCVLWGRGLDSSLLVKVLCTRIPK